MVKRRTVFARFEVETYSRVDHLNEHAMSGTQTTVLPPVLVVGTGSPHSDWMAEVINPNGIKHSGLTGQITQFKATW